MNAWQKLIKFCPLVKNVESRFSQFKDRALVSVCYLWQWLCLLQCPKWQQWWSESHRVVRRFKWHHTLNSQWKASTQKLAAAILHDTPEKHSEYLHIKSTTTKTWLGVMYNSVSSTGLSGYKLLKKYTPRKCWLLPRLLSNWGTLAMTLRSTRMDVSSDASIPCMQNMTGQISSSGWSNPHSGNFWALTLPRLPRLVDSKWDENRTLQNFSIRSTQGPDAWQLRAQTESLSSVEEESEPMLQAL